MSLKYEPSSEQLYISATLETLSHTRMCLPLSVDAPRNVEERRQREMEHISMWVRGEWAGGGVFTYVGHRDSNFDGRIDS